MSKILSVIFLSYILFSCNEAKRDDTSQNVDIPKAAIGALKRSIYKNLSEVVEEKESLRYWAARESYYPTLHFNNSDTLSLDFNGQCGYRFPFKIKDGRIAVYWDIIEDCTHDIGIKKSFGLGDRPVKGKPFMTLSLTNDTTLHASYLYKDWVDHFNGEYESYKYLPETFLSIGD